KTLVTAVDAATAPNPSANAAKPAQRSAPSPSAPPASTPTQRPAKTEPVVHPTSARVVQQAARTTTQARQTGQGLVRGSKRFGEAVWKPFVKLSGVLWLEVVGVFFGLFAVFGAGWAWKLRGNLHETATNHDAHQRFVTCVVMTVVFGYFLVTSFLK